MSARDVTQLAHLTTEEVRARLGQGATVVLLPVGSVEPHGPHLPLGTDTFISEAVARRAAERLEPLGTRAWIAPSVSYGVTNYAQGFAGAVSVPPAALTAWLRAVVESFLAIDGISLVCLINNHLEPAHDAAVRAAASGIARAIVASPLERRWARTLSDEFKRGECHAGRYETSIVLAHDAALVDMERAHALDDVHVSLSDKIKQGIDTFAAMGMRDAYSGSPRTATAPEGRDLVDRLAAMVETEVTEALQRSTSPG